MGEYIELLRRNRNYRYLWFGNVVSLLGDWFNLLASAELITDITNSGIAISYLFLARFLPMFLFSPLAGVIADRFDRRKVMIVSDLLRAVTVLGFLLVGITGQIWLLYVLTVTQFVLSALFTPARSAILANVVAPKDLVAANALDSFTWSTMLAIGSFLGGVATAVFGAETAFILDALTFVLSAWLISRIVIVKNRETAVAVQSTGWFDFVEGFRYLWREPFILGISLVKAFGSLVWGSINVLEIAFADQVYPLNNAFFSEVLKVADGGTVTLGIIYVISGLGTGLGPLLMRRWLGDIPTRLMLGISIGFFLMAGGIMWLGLAPTFGIFLGATLVRTIGTGTLWVFSAAMLQMLVPDKFRGRVFAFEFAMLTLTQSISTLFAGFAQDSIVLSVEQIAIGMGAFGLLISLLWFGFHMSQSNYVKHNLVLTNNQ